MQDEAHDKSLAGKLAMSRIQQQFGNAGGARGGPLHLDPRAQQIAEQSGSLFAGAGDRESEKEGKPKKERSIPALVAAFPDAFAGLRAQLIPHLARLGKKPQAAPLAGEIQQELRAIARTASTLRRLGSRGPAAQLALRLGIHRERLAALLRRLEGLADTEGGKVEKKDTEEHPSERDGMNDMSEMTSLRLQMTMDRRSKVIQTLSNIMKKIQTTQDAIVSNIK